MIDFRWVIRQSVHFARIQKFLLAMLACAALYCLEAKQADAQANNNRAIIVLDGSGSMWGQIDGKAKISIARDVLSGVLAGPAGDMRPGFMSYGHRQKGRCDDIELILEPGEADAGALAKVADGISPKGKTPLSMALQQAAGALRSTENKATVILITDGLETCNADPCAVASALEASGVDFTAHVVGFGLSADEGRKVACIAENTGGLYIPAGDEAALDAALTQAVEEVAQAAAPQPESAPEQPPQLPEAGLDAPAQVEIGKRFRVGWTGPGGQHDFVYLMDIERPMPDGRDRGVSGQRLINGDFDGKTVELSAPVRPGQYELRYLYDKSRHVIATRAIEVVEAAVSLDGPATVDIGREFVVIWKGPGERRDTVQLFDTQADGGRGKLLRDQRIVNGDMESRTVRVVAPAEPGFYQLRYWSGEGRAVLASREIEVLPAETGLLAPGSVGIGQTFRVSWTGPGGRRDRVDIFDPAADGGRGRIVGGKRLINDDVDGRTVALVAPVTAGRYTLQYYNGDNRTVLAETQIEVVALEVGLDAPDTALMAHTFKVVWQGPGAIRDSIQLHDPAAKGGKGDILYAIRILNGDMDRKTVDIIAPATPGDYELRYWSGDGGRALATRPITVEPMEVSLTSPSSVEAGTTFVVAWAGPGAIRDSVQIFDPTAKAGKGDVLAVARLSNGDTAARTVTIKAPATTGSFVLRYWNGDWSKVLAEIPITVN